MSDAWRGKCACFLRRFGQQFFGLMSKIVAGCEVGAVRTEGELGAFLSMQAEMDHTNAQLRFWGMSVFQWVAPAKKGKL